MARLISLESWARLTYGDDAPHIVTLRRWAREGKIAGAVKQGRSYFVPPDAVYAQPAKQSSRGRLLDRLESYYGPSTP